MQISAFQAYPGISPSQGLPADSASSVGSAADDVSASGRSITSPDSGGATGSSTGGSSDDARSYQPSTTLPNTAESPNPDVEGQQQAEKKAVEAAEQAQLVADQKQIEQLAERDREVRAHEQAHAAVGGQYAGSPVYDYTRGPNGRNYASSGHVKIDVSAIPGDPEATLQKAETVRRAALAPAEPSSADRSVAAKASQMAVEARAEIARNRGPAGDDDKPAGDGVTAAVVGAEKPNADDPGADKAAPGAADTPYRSLPTDLGSLLNTTV